MDIARDQYLMTFASQKSWAAEFERLYEVKTAYKNPNQPIAQKK